MSTVFEMWLAFAKRVPIPQPPIWVTYLILTLLLPLGPLYSFHAALHLEAHWFWQGFLYFSSTFMLVVVSYLLYHMWKEFSVNRQKEQVARSETQLEYERRILDGRLTQGFLVTFAIMLMAFACNEGINLPWPAQVLLGFVIVMSIVAFTLGFIAIRKELKCVSPPSP